MSDQPYQMKSSVPKIRIRTLNRIPDNPTASFVLYWMIGARRTRFNFALQRAADESHRLGLPLVVLEPLRLDYPWACSRFHNFVIDGMVDNYNAFEKTTVHYYPYIEDTRGAGRGMLKAFAKHAALIVSDDAPFFFLPDALSAAAKQCSIKMEVVDSNGLYPLHATQRVFTTAASFRRHLQKELPDHLLDLAARNPLSRRKINPLKRLPPTLSKRWPKTPIQRLLKRTWINDLFLDHSVGPKSIRGGSDSALQVLTFFRKHKLLDFASARNHPLADCQSHLSPYLHFGHISAHEIFYRVMQDEGWTPGSIADRATGSRHGWWGVGESTESFLDQFITWRELGYNAATHQPNYQRYGSLPTWAQHTLKNHATDKRTPIYTLAAFEAAKTHDPLWNAAQRQLVTEGTIHNYLRMLWGKKILEWTANPHRALRIMVELNNKYAFDGRDPNSYSGILWTLGKYDRAWGERPIFGKVRYMSSENTRRKINVQNYIERYSSA